MNHKLESFCVVLALVEQILDYILYYFEIFVGLLTNYYLEKKQVFRLTKFF